MTLKSILKKQDIEQGTGISNELIESAEERVGIQFGKQLKEYLIHCGYLAYEHIEFYGINSNQKLSSDLVTTTEYLHKYFPKTSNKIAFENQGEGDYYLVDSSDKMYEYNSEIDELTDMKLSLFEYIQARFNSID